MGASKVMLDDFLTNIRGPFGAIMVIFWSPRPRQTSENVFLVDAASHESSGARLGPLLNLLLPLLKI